MDLKLPKMLCKDSKQHHVMFHELNSVSSLLCIAQNVRFEIPYKDLYFETPFLMIFKYYAWASYDQVKLFAYEYTRTNVYFCFMRIGGFSHNLSYGKLLQIIYLFIYLCSTSLFIFYLLILANLIW